MASASDDEIEQDYDRFIFKPAGGNGNSNTIRKFILNNVLTALDDGYDVILEGILNVRSYGGVLSTIFQNHPKDNYCFYFDISIDETIKRHRMRNNANLATEEDMRGWYKDKDFPATSTFQPTSAYCPHLNAPACRFRFKRCPTSSASGRSHQRYSVSSFVASSMN